MRGLTQRRVALRWHQARKKIRKVLGKMLSPTRREDLVLERAAIVHILELPPALPLCPHHLPQEAG